MIKSTNLAKWCHASKGAVMSIGMLMAFDAVAAAPAYSNSEAENVVATIPGTIQAEDMDAENYYFQQTSAVKHDYRDDVDVAISTAGGITKIGNTSKDDYFTYTFNCTEAGRYEVTTYASTGTGTGSYTLTFDMGTDNEMEFTETFDAYIPEGKSNGWDYYVETITHGVDLEEGIHTMRFTVVKGVNLDKFEFTRVGDITVSPYPGKRMHFVPGSFLGGDMDSEEGSYYNKQFVEEGATLKNDYKANQDVKVRINGNGVVGNTSPDDFFTYYISAEKGGHYILTVWCEAPTNSHAHFNIVFDDNADTKVVGGFDGEGWGKAVGVPVEIDLETGDHKMVFTVESGLNLEKFDFARVKSADEIFHSIPADNAIIAGMLDMENGSYHHQKYQDGQNSYAGNPNVHVKIDANGKIGDTSQGDFYTYTFMCTESGDYEVTAVVIGSAGSEKEVRFTFHSEEEQVTTAKFTGQGWGDANTMEVKADNKVNLEEGVHTMKVELPLTGGIDLKEYRLVKDGVSTGIECVESNKNALVKVYSIDGRYLRTVESAGKALDGLAPGIYIIGNQKIVKR